MVNVTLANVTLVLQFVFQPTPTPLSYLYPKLLDIKGSRSDSSAGDQHGISSTVVSTSESVRSGLGGGTGSGTGAEVTCV